MVMVPTYEDMIHWSLNWMFEVSVDVEKIFKLATFKHS